MLYSLQFEIKVSYQTYTVIWVMKRRLSIINLSSEINLPTFWLNAPVVIRVKLLEHSVEISFSELKLVTDIITFSSFFLQPTEKPMKHLADGNIIMGMKLFLYLLSNILPSATLGKLSTLKNVQNVYAKNWILLNRCCEISYMWVAAFKMVTWSRWYSLIIASGPDRFSLGGICHSNSSTAHLWQHHLCNAKQFTYKCSSCVKIVAFIGLL